MVREYLLLVQRGVASPARRLALENSVRLNRASALNFSLGFTRSCQLHDQNVELFILGLRASDSLLIERKVRISR